MPPWGTGDSAAAAGELVAAAGEPPPAAKESAQTAGELERDQKGSAGVKRRMGVPSSEPGVPRPCTHT